MQACLIGSGNDPIISGGGSFSEECVFFYVSAIENSHSVERSYVISMFFPFLWFFLSVRVRDTPVSFVLFLCAKSCTLGYELLYSVFFLSL